MPHLSLCSYNSTSPLYLSSAVLMCVLITSNCIHFYISVDTTRPHLHDVLGCTNLVTNYCAVHYFVVHYCSSETQRRNHINYNIRRRPRQKLLCAVKVKAECHCHAKHNKSHNKSTLDFRSWFGSSSMFLPLFS